MATKGLSGQANTEFHNEVLILGSWLLGSAFIGVAIAFPHVLVILVSNAKLDWGIGKYFTVVVGASYLVASAFGGVGLAKLTRWALTQTKCRSFAVALSMGMAAAGVSLYSMCHASSVAAYVSWFLQHRYAHIYGALLAAIYALVFGAFHWVSSLLRLATRETVGVIYVALLVAIAAYYLAIVLWSAVRTVRRQKRELDDALRAQGWGVAAGTPPPASPKR